MPVELVPSPASAGRREQPRLSVGPIYDCVVGGVVRAGVLAIAGGLVSPRPFWELLQQLALGSDWRGRGERDDDPFPAWQPDDPPCPIFWEDSMSKKAAIL